MATITQQEVAPLHKYLNVTINREDYLPKFEKSLKEYSKKANIPGFRKGMVPAGLIKKMYGNSLFVDEILKTVDHEVFSFIETEKLDIFAQPLPVDLKIDQLDVNNPNNYTFTFEVGMKPDFQLPDLAQKEVKKYKVQVDENMINEEVERLRTRYGNMTEPESVTGDENVLNITFIETDASGNELDGGIRKDNSLLVKYFNEAVRPQLIGKKKDDTLQISLDEAFASKEKEWVMNDLGIDSSTGKNFKLLCEWPDWLAAPSSPPSPIVRIDCQVLYPKPRRSAFSGSRSGRSPRSSQSSVLAWPASTPSGCQWSSSSRHWRSSSRSSCSSTSRSPTWCRERTTTPRGSPPRCRSPPSSSATCRGASTSGSCSPAPAGRCTRACGRS